jgi:hypothetical protein
MMRHFSSSPIHFHLYYHCTSYIHELETTSDGCKDSLSHGEIEEEVYIEKPKGFVIHDEKSHMCRLKKA